MAAESIAFPLISTGAYGYPPDEGFDVAVESINHALNRTMYTNNAILCLLEPRTISQRATNIKNSVTGQFTFTPCDILSELNSVC